MAEENDRIETDVVIAAPLERVWQLVTSAEHLGCWFGNAGAEVELRPGGALSLTWRDHGTVHGRVEAVEAPHRFAFRWLRSPGLRADPVPGNSTLAELTLTAEGDSTRVTVVETGFAQLDGTPEERTAALASNSRGWPSELAELAAYAEGVPAAGR